jgi:RNA polymerase sigma-70 factor (ECF subfamily)
VEPNAEKALVERARSDPQAFGLIFDEYYRAIFGYILRRTANVEVARDISAEVFLKALRSVSTFQWRGVSISSWLYRIASNEVAAYFRDRKYEGDSLDELREVAGFEPPESQDMLEEIVTAEREVERHADFLHVQKLLERLPQRSQEVIALRFFEGKRIKEIAEILGKGEGTVKSLLSRGLDQLRRLHDAVPPP